MKRLEYIDVAKFLGMVLVVLTHARGGEKDFIAFVYGFHMPLFFLINGLTIKLKEGDTFGSYLVRKLKSYLVPMVFLTIYITLGIMFVNALRGTNLPDKFFINQLVSSLDQKRFYPIWFVGALLSADIMFYVPLKYGKNIIGTSIISVLFLVLAILYNTHVRTVLLWNIDAAMFGVFFIYLGYLFNRPELNKIKSFILDKRWISLLVGLATFAIGFVFVYINWKQFHSHLDMWGSNYKHYYLTLPGAAFMSFGFVFICNAIRNKVMGELGKSTIVILAFHQEVTFALYRLWWPDAINYFEKMGELGLMINASLMTVLSFALILAFYYLIIYSPLAFTLNKKMPEFYKRIFKKKEA